MEALAPQFLDNAVMRYARIVLEVELYGFRGDFLSGLFIVHPLVPVGAKHLMGHVLVSIAGCSKDTVGDGRIVAEEHIAYFGQLIEILRIV